MSLVVCLYAANKILCSWKLSCLPSTFENNIIFIVWFFLGCFNTFNNNLDIECLLYGTKYSRTDQVKFVTDSL